MFENWVRNISLFFYLFLDIESKKNLIVDSFEMELKHLNPRVEISIVSNL